jgi:hypothetical protein
MRALVKMADPVPCLESIESFVTLFQYHCGLARLPVGNVLGRMNLDTKISAMADKVQSQCWIDFTEVGQDSYFARLVSLRLILSNYYESLAQSQNWAPEQKALGEKFFDFYDELKGKFESEVMHVINYVRDSYTAAERDLATFVPVGDDGEGNDVTVLKDPAASITAPAPADP